jgi:hypothetical protein
VFAILCTGPSLSQAVVDSVRGMRVIAVNNAFELSPNAEALAANDMAWWKHNPKARDFAGRKFTTNVLPGVERVISSGVLTESCSGVLGLEVAKIIGAMPGDPIYLFGVDFHGSHYFGEYTNGLKNTTDARRKIHARQFENWAKANPRYTVFNATPGSALRAFPMARSEMACELGLRCATNPTTAETLSSVA